MMVGVLAGSLSKVLICAGVAVSMVGYLVYVRDIRRGTADPDLVSWGLWTVIPLLAFATQFTEGVGIVALDTFTAGLGPALIVMAALRAPRAPQRLHPIDLLCGSIAAVGVVVWITSGNPELGLWAFLAADLGAGVPTLFKVWFEPDSESKLCYVMDVVTSGLVVVCATRFSVATIGFALVDTLVAVATLAFALTRVGHRVHGIADAAPAFEDHHVLGHLPHAHKHLTHFHPVLRPHLPEHRPRYFEHLARLRAELPQLGEARQQG